MPSAEGHKNNPADRACIFKVASQSALDPVLLTVASRGHVA